MKTINLKINNKFIMKTRDIFANIILIAVIVSCNMKKSNTDVIAPGTDSTMMAKDSSTSNTSATLVGDTSSAALGTKTTVGSADTKAAIVKTDSSISMGAKKSKKGKVSIAEGTKATGDMTADKEGFYTNTEVLPAFPGGQKALERFFEDNIQYPDNATENNAEGTVNLTFAVDESGKVYAPKVVSKNIGYGIEPEALRVFNKMPKWTPGKIKGKNVKTKYTLPIKFKLD